MSADKDRVRTLQVRAVGRQEVSDMHADAWRTELTAIFADDAFTLRPYLERIDMKVGELEFRLDAHAPRTEADVPQGVT